MNQISRFALIALLIAIAAQRAMAGTLAFDFSFHDEFSGNNVVGIVSGLNDNAGGPASSVLVTSNSGGYGVGEYVGNPGSNFWALESGIITLVLFESLGVQNTSPAVTCCSFAIAHGHPQILGANLNDSPFFVHIRNGSRVTFTVRPSEIPVPAGIVLLGLGLCGLVVTRRKREL